MAYRYNGVECDTFEELQRLQGAARTTSAVVKEKRRGEPGGRCSGQKSGSRPIGDDTDYCTLMQGHKGPCKF